MSRIKKTSPLLNLSNFQTFILDSNPLSQYFKISELSDGFTAGKNGFLIEHDDDFEDNFANKIIEVLTDDALNESLIDYAATSMKDFTHDAVAQRWQKLIKSF